MRFPVPSPPQAPTPLSIPRLCNVQRKPKKPVVGGVQEGNARALLSRLSPVGPSFLVVGKGPCLPYSFLQPGGLLLLLSQLCSWREGGVVALSSHPQINCELPK